MSVREIIVRNVMMKVIVRIVQKHFNSMRKETVNQLIVHQLIIALDAIIKLVLNVLKTTK